jgi:hypothetical protein
MGDNEARQQPTTTPLLTQDLGQNATMIIFSLLPIMHCGRFASPLFTSTGYVHDEVFPHLVNENLVQ